ncbi:MAG TPA: CBS domain-containing protein [Solirubrobacteraceae bacterium]|jgi:CBS domain-containing protein|nr:CBS domain-containing protein [Solirubrobacteraceae bacterium]
MPDAVLHLSSLVGSPLLDSAGKRLGRVEDVIARLDLGDRLPPVTGLMARIAGRDMFVPAGRIAHLEPAAARTSTTKLNLGQFERRPGELMLRADVLGRSLINVNTARLVRANEVELACESGTWRVTAIDPSLRARVRRLLPRRFRAHQAQDDQLVPWSETEPFVGHVPTSRLRLRPLRLARLHAAQIADLVEAASHQEGEEIMQAVGQDKELEADVFEELDEEHQLEFLRNRSDADVAAVLSRMASDDAADLLLEIDQDRRIPVLNLLPAAKQRKIRGLLGYNPSTAGGVMNPDYVAVADHATVAAALSSVRASEIPASEIESVYVIGAGGRLVGAVCLAELIRAAEERDVSTLTHDGAPVVSADADVPEIARVMTDYNLLSIPVVDVDGRMIGAVSVDDVLELTLPADWRRRYGLARD